MSKTIKKPLKKSNLNFIYFFNGNDRESKHLAGFVRDRLKEINFYNYINFSFINVGSKTLKLDEFIKSKTFKNANIIFIEKAYADLIKEENLIGKEVNVLDKGSFEVAERLAGTYNGFCDFCDSIQYTIKEYINNYYGNMKCFQIVNRSACRIKVTEDVEATCIMQMENRCFTEYNKDDFEEVCKNLIQKSISMEELNMKRLEMALNDSKNNLQKLKNRLAQIDSEIRGL